MVSYEVRSRNGKLIRVLKLYNPFEEPREVREMELDGHAYKTSCKLRPRDYAVFLKIEDFLVAPLDSSLKLFPLDSTYYELNKFLTLGLECPEMPCELWISSRAPPSRVVSNTSLRWSFDEDSKAIRISFSSNFTKTKLIIDFSRYADEKQVEDKRRLEELLFRLEQKRELEKRLQERISEMERKIKELNSTLEELKRNVSSMIEEKNKLSIETESLRLLALAKGERIKACLLYTSPSPRDS